MDTGKRHKQPEPEHVLFIVGQPVGLVEIEQRGKFFFRQEYNDRLGPRCLVGVEGVTMNKTGAHRGVIVHTQNAHIFADCAGTVAQLVAQINRIRPEKFGRYFVKI